MLKILTLTVGLSMVGLLPSNLVHAENSASSWNQELRSINDITGKALDYSVSGYRIRMEFLSTERIRWTRLEAPDDTAGTSGEEEITLTDLRPGLFSIAFTEADGNVVDIFDLQRQQIFIAYITNDGKRFQSQAAFEVAKPQN